MLYTWRVYKLLNGNWKTNHQIDETESHPSSGSFRLIVSSEFRWPLLILLVLTALFEFWSITLTRVVFSLLSYCVFTHEYEGSRPTRHSWWTVDSVPRRMYTYRITFATNFSFRRLFGSPEMPSKDFHSTSSTYCVPGIGEQQMKWTKILILQGLTF